MTNSNAQILIHRFVLFVVVVVVGGGGSLFVFSSFSFKCKTIMELKEY